MTFVNEEKQKGKEKKNRWEGEEKECGKFVILLNLLFIQCIVGRDCDAALGLMKVRGRGRNEG